MIVGVGQSYLLVCGEKRIYVVGLVTVENVLGRDFISYLYCGSRLRSIWFVEVLFLENMQRIDRKFIILFDIYLWLLKYAYMCSQELSKGAKHQKLVNNNIMEKTLCSQPYEKCSSSRSFMLHRNYHLNFQVSHVSVLKENLRTITGSSCLLRYDL